MKQENKTKLNNIMKYLGKRQLSIYGSLEEAPEFVRKTNPENINFIYESDETTHCNGYDISHHNGDYRNNTYTPVEFTDKITNRMIEKYTNQCEEKLKNDIKREQQQREQELLREKLKEFGI